MNSGILKTFDPKKVVVTWGGIVMTDYANGTFVEITQEDNYEPVEGADGSENRVNKNRNGADCTITLMQQSATNDLLSTAFLIDKNTNTGVKPFLIKDLHGTSLYFSQAAYIKKLADASEADSVSNRQWVFRLTQVVGYVGGNL